MPELTEAELKKQLAAGELCGVYLIAGEEKYLVKRSASRLVKKAAGEAFPEFNRNEFGNDSSIDSIADAALALPFFAEHKCVSVSDFNVEEKDAVELQKLYELIETSPDTTSLVFWYPTLEFDGKKSAKWKKLLKAVGERGGVLIHERRSAAELQKLLLREAEKAGCALPRQNAARIVEYAGQDVTQLLHEMEKLCAFALGQAEEQGGGALPEITEEMIEALVPPSFSMYDGERSESVGIAAEAIMLWRRPREWPTSWQATKRIASPISESGSTSERASGLAAAVCTTIQS